MEKSFTLLEGLIGEFPQDDHYRSVLIVQRYLMGLFYQSLGRPQDAREQNLRTIQLCRQTADLDVGAETMNNCSWILVDCPDETLRDPDLAVALAQRAVAHEPDKAGYWNTLGVAYYRKGDWKNARLSLEQSIQKSDGGTAHDWFFLAMSCQRLGDVEHARSWRDKAVRRLNALEAKPEELLRYRTEADALLGP